MKNKHFVKFILILTICVLLASCFANSAVFSKTNSLQNFYDGIISYKLKESGADSIQEWTDGYLTDNAGTMSEWYILALYQNDGKYNFTAYQNALKNYLSDNTVFSATTRQKLALIMKAVSSSDDAYAADYISSVMEDSIGKQGIMSWVYGLHLLNNGCLSDTHTSDSVIQKLLELQLEDGGWALTGANGDVDVTAMTVQALAPHYDSDDVKSAVDNAVTLLSSRQLEEGDYSSYGVQNAESTAQVIIALSSLGIDCASDSRFIKNGKTLFDGLGKYKLENGSFCHDAGGSSNETATAQVFCAAVAYMRMTENKGSLYIFDTQSSQPGTPGVSTPDINTPAPTSAPAQTTDDAQSSEHVQSSEQMQSSGSYKPWVCIIILAAAAVICIVLYIKGKRHWKNFAAVVIIAIIGISFVYLTDFQSAENYYKDPGSEKENAVGTVTITIRCDNIVGKSDSEYIPEDGVVLETTEFAIDKDDTVYDILVEATRKYSIHMENTGNGNMAYIAGINYIYEFDFGDLSGWMYLVNGERASVGCDSYRLSDGDTIEWHYTCELGNDIKK